MTRAIRFFIVFVLTVVIVPFLPLYIERTMLRSWRVDRAGDVIEYGWKVCTLSSYWHDYRYISREQQPAFWLAVNVTLAFLYSLIVALLVDQLLVRRKKSAAHSFKRS
jgi:hypothetical protein